MKRTPEEWHIFFCEESGGYVEDAGHEGVAVACEMIAAEARREALDTLDAKIIARLNSTLAARGATAVQQACNDGHASALMYCASEIERLRDAEKENP
jgi:hypothetical protein